MKPGNNTGQIIINFLIKLDIPALLFLKRIRIIIETKGRIINHLYWFCIYQEFMAHWRIILFAWTIPGHISFCGKSYGSGSYAATIESEWNRVVYYYCRVGRIDCQHYCRTIFSWEIEKDNNVYLIVPSKDNILSGEYIIFF